MMMTRLTTIVGALLVLTGVVAFVVTSTSSITALIPAFVGGLLLICAAISSRPNAAPARHPRRPGGRAARCPGLG